MGFTNCAWLIVLTVVVSTCGSTPEKQDPVPARPGSGSVTSPAKAAEASAAVDAVFDGPGRPGFEVIEMDGRLWIFGSGSEALVSFLSGGEPAKRVTRVGRGPGGETILGPDTETLDSYAAALKYGRPGFAVFEEDGRLWVFREDGDGLKEFIEVGEPAKRITRIGAGPDGMTIMAPDAETLDAFLAR